MIFSNKFIMHNKRENFRSYNPNLNFNKNSQITIVPSEKYNEILNESKATIHVYLYLCSKVNNHNNDGYISSIHTRRISSIIGIPLRTVQKCLETLTVKKFATKISRNKDKSVKLYLLGYNIVNKEDYIKLPPFIFSKEFMSYDKPEILGFLGLYYDSYTNIINSLNKIERNRVIKHKYQLIQTLNLSREIKEDIILKKIKRTGKKDLKKVLKTLNKAGWLEVVDINENKPNSLPKYIINDRKILSIMFEEVFNMDIDINSNSIDLEEALKGILALEELKLDNTKLSIKENEQLKLGIQSLLDIIRIQRKK